MRGACLVLRCKPGINGIIPAHAGSITTSVSPTDFAPGSSPHMRGAYLQQRAKRLQRRIIPAHAGSIVEARLRHGPPPDHPRTCGEHRGALVRPSPQVGSSPHMRGACVDVRLVGDPDRIIPAHAGSIMRAILRLFITTDHPRTCGEHVTSMGVPLLAFRIIPAHAGSIGRRHSRYRRSWDHPRTCGEHLAATGLMDRRGGSSPHMRGASQGRRRPPTRDRIIPAHAGSIKVPQTKEGQSEDHPRTCGEHYQYLAGLSIGSGSSPHMRGAYRLHEGEALEVGIIPAHAGSMQISSATWSVAGDHPRTCGEHLGDRAPAQPELGSSPHMRGAFLRHLMSFPMNGIIPAHAGSITRSNGSNISVYGSSPHMRGAFNSNIVVKTVERIIPAHAGSIASSVSSGPPLRDHPRTCGEHGSTR